MRLALNTSSLSSAHKFRGLGFYTRRLLHQLKKAEDIAIAAFSNQLPKNVDLVHYPAFTLFHPLKNIPLRSRIPVVFTVHDLIPLKYPQHFPPGLKGKLRWRRQKKVLQKVQAIITDSQASKKDIVKFTGISSKKVFVIYLAADKVFQPVKDKPWLQKIKKRYHLPDKFILYVGDMNWNKNIIALVKSSLKLQYPLVVVSKQAMANDFNPRHPEVKDLVLFQELAKTHPQTVIRLGFVPTRDLVGIYNLATCYVQPSWAEGFGLPVLEAMACGCPVITSKATSLAEIAGQAALFINPSHQSELVTALKDCWQNQALRKKLTRLGLNQSQKFSWQKTAQETIKVYQKVYEKKVYEKT